MLFFRMYDMEVIIRTRNWLKNMIKDKVRDFFKSNQKPPFVIYAIEDDKGEFHYIDDPLLILVFANSDKNFDNIYFCSDYISK